MKPIPIELEIDRKRIQKMQDEYKRFPRFERNAKKTALYHQIELAMQKYEYDCAKRRF